MNYHYNMELDNVKHQNDINLKLLIEEKNEEKCTYSG